MTAKEKREMQRIKNRVEELEKERDRQFKIYRENLVEVVELRTALKNVCDCLTEALEEATRVLGGVEDETVG